MQLITFFFFICQQHYAFLKQNSIGNARFMKTIRGRHKDGYVVVKIFVKPELGMSLSKYIKKIKSKIIFLCKMD
jgi:hypothetical protein